MRATYRSRDCWGLTPVEVCIKLSVSDQQTFAHLYFRNVATISTNILSWLVSLDTTHDKKVSSSQTTCLTDLPSWLRSQASYSGRRNVCPSLYAFVVCSQIRSYLFVLTAEVDSGQQQQQKKSRETIQQRRCLHVYLKSRLSAAHTRSGKHIYVNCRWGGWLYSPHCTCEWTICPIVHIS